MGQTRSIPIVITELEIGIANASLIASWLLLVLVWYDQRLIVLVSTFETIFNKKPELQEVVLKEDIARYGGQVAYDMNDKADKTTSAALMKVIQMMYNLEESITKT